MRQPRVTKSRDALGHEMYECVIEVYDIRTGKLVKECKASAPDDLEACRQAADQGLDFLRNLPDEHSDGEETQA